MKTHSFMWCKFFTEEDVQSISRFKEAPFYTDFYTHVLKSYYKKTGETQNIDLKSQRGKLKSTMMYVLFDNNFHHRNNNPYIRMVQSVFPGVDKWITEFHKLIGPEKFSYLLQRVESYLMLDVICREFNQIFPQAPLFTIHDGILTFREHVHDLTGFVLTRLGEITGVDGGAKSTCPQIVREPFIGDIDKLWDKISGNTTPEKYEKVRGGVLSSNIDRGSDFLKTRI